MSDEVYVIAGPVALALTGHPRVEVPITLVATPGYVDNDTGEVVDPWGE